MMRPPHMPHMNQMQTATHHMSNISQHQQPHINMATGQQPHNHMMHSHQNYHPNRSGNQHNHHSQQRMSYGQNRPSFHSGSHNMHSNHGPNNVANMSTTVTQSQQQPTNINKIDTNCANIQPLSNAQPRYKQQSMDPASNMANQTSHNVAQKPSIQTSTSNKENVHNVERIDINHGCINDSSALNVIAPSNTSSKTKTPMCIINEMVRAHQLKHQYRVTDERGPSHDKLYTVVLELGDERYTAQSKTIKGAQQSAAAAALEKTKFKQPVGRPQRVVMSRRPTNTITPTVQLNALAMKRGIPTHYSYQYPKSHNEQTLMMVRNPRNNKGNKNRFHDKFANNRSPQFVHRTTEDDPYRVTVTIGDKQFSGTGLTMQSAKHDAAAKALLEFKDEPVKPVQSSIASSFETTDKLAHANGDVTVENTQTTFSVDTVKSAISVVQEIAQKRDLPIRFVVESETGPAHMKHFVMKCSVGEIETIGDGNSKKVAKKHAAENMLNELKKLPPLRPAGETQGNGRRQKFNGKRNATSNSRQQVQQTNARQKGATSMKEMNTSTLNTETSVTPTNTIGNVSANTTITDENEMSNPVAVLLRIQQASKQKEPIYTVVEERGQGRRKEFTMEVNCGRLVGRGVGGSKKVAKREAAKSILIQIGYGDSGNSESATVHSNSVTDKNRKVTFSEAKVYSENVGQSAGGAAGRQLVPGILLMKNPENNRKAKNSQSGINYTTTATIAKELLDAGTSPTAEAMINQSSPVKKAPVEETKPTTAAAEVSPTKVEPNNNNIGETTKPATQSHAGIRATDQLLYLADLLKFEVQFDDFPRGNHKDYLTLASLNTDPPQMFHGSGNSLEASKNQAALAALKALSELGLDNVNKPKSILSNGKSN